MSQRLYFRLPVITPFALVRVDTDPATVSPADVVTVEGYRPIPGSQLRADSDGDLGDVLGPEAINRIYLKSLSENITLSGDQADVPDLTGGTPAGDLAGAAGKGLAYANGQLLIAVSADTGNSVEFGTDNGLYVPAVVVDSSGNTIATQGPAGPKGDKGDPGDPGAPGAPGAPGVPGPAGPQGIQGLTGSPGPAGPQGDPGIKGDPGLTGPAGAVGATGSPGSVGPAGPAGPAGQDGAVGASGATGATGAQGPQGIPGDPGPAGATGPAGPAGTDATITTEDLQDALGGGLGDGLVYLDAQNQIAAKLSADTGNAVSFGTDGGLLVPASDAGVGAAGAPGPAGPAGPAGPKGDPGDPGPAGTTGPAGATGPEGAVGATGPAGPQGIQGLPGDPGPAGNDGPAGATGPAGAVGPAGPTGAPGDTGSAGPAGPAGNTGPAGDPGPAGPGGPAGSVTVGTTTTGAPGTAAAVTNTGTESAAVLNFTVPTGPAGDTGPAGSTGAAGPPGDPGPAGSTGPAGPAGTAATVAVGTVTTGTPGSGATVTNVGTPADAVFDFSIPQGIQGPTGGQGPAGQTGATGPAGSTGPAATLAVGTVTPGAPGSSPQVTNSGTPGAAVLDFTLPQGSIGPAGTAGATGPAGTAATLTVGTVATSAPGSSATVTNSGTPTDAVLNFSVPQGTPGPAGATGPAGVAATIKVGPTSFQGGNMTPTVTNAGTAQDADLRFLLPAPMAASGAVANTLAPGSAATVAISTPYNPYFTFGIPTGATGPAGPAGAAGAAGPAGTPYVAPTALTTAAYTTAALTAGASEQGSIGMLWGYRVVTVQTSAPARVRLYTSAAARAADLVRGAGVDPGYNSGVVLDAVTTDTALVALAPEATGHNLDGPSGNIPLTVTAVGSGPVTVSLGYTAVH